MMKHKALPLANKVLPLAMKHKALLFLLALAPYAAAFSQSPVGYAATSSQPLPSSQPQPSDAQKVITRSTMVGAGPTKILDTYLSAEHFSGTGLSFISSVERHREGKHWSTLIEHEANISSVKDRAGKQQELEAAYNLYWGKLYNWQLLDGKLQLQAGGVANALLGVIYNTSNSNNPAQARAHLNIMPVGTASYHFQLFHKKMMARYELALPLCGIMFSPNYGQSYHELFNRGNYDHNVVPTTFIAAPEWRQMLTLDCQLSRTFTLRLGYLGNMQQQDVNQLKQHVYTHRLLIGFTKRFSIIPRSL